MWQLLKGHDHLQDEFSVFFDHLRPSASRLGDFEEINWTEEKEYEVWGGGCLPGLFWSAPGRGMDLGEGEVRSSDPPRRRGGWEAHLKLQEVNLASPLLPVRRV